MSVPVGTELPTVHPLSAPQATDLVLRRIESAEPLLLGNLNLHGLYMYYTDESFRTFCRKADVVVVDGWPLTLLARGRTGHGRRGRAVPRIGSTDWLFPLIDADPAITVVAVGGTPTSAKAAAEEVRRRCRKLRWLAFDGFDSRGATVDADELGLTAALDAADLVLVGMGMPRQERWILSHRSLMPTAVVANVGGCLDYLAGEQPLAPRWLGRWGLEWAYRLLRDPRRLAYRYLVEPVRLLAVLLARRQPPWVEIAQLPT